MQFIAEAFLISLFAGVRSKSFESKEISWSLYKAPKLVSKNSFGSVKKFVISGEISSSLDDLLLFDYSIIVFIKE
jgi:hypothetical protein